MAVNLAAIRELSPWLYLSSRSNSYRLPLIYSRAFRSVKLGLSLQKQRFRYLDVAFGVA